MRPDWTTLDYRTLDTLLLITLKSMAVFLML